MYLALLAASLLHGVVALAWIGGLRRLAAPISAALTASLLMLALLLPVVVVAARLAQVPSPPDHWLLVRAGDWLTAILAAGPGPKIALVTLLAGTTLVFAVQELLPLRKWRPRRWTSERTRDPRLEASLERVLSAVDRLPATRLRGRVPRVRALETDGAVAALHGFVDPVVIVSRGLLDRLDDDELDCVIAHEVAHRLRGGNLVPLLAWLARVPQAASPAALVLYRSWVEAQEQACDALAAELTGRPAALADVLLKLHRQEEQGAAAEEGEGLLRRSRRELLRRAEVDVTRTRIRAVLDSDGGGAAPRWLVGVSALVLGAMLWGIA